MTSAFCAYSHSQVAGLTTTVSYQVHTCVGAQFAIFVSLSIAKLSHRQLLVPQIRPYCIATRQFPLSSY